jgi:hypothetical protein
MTTWLKQSTATDVELGPFIDSTDGATVETGLTISQADCQLIKNGGAAAQKNDSTSATHLAGGHYKVPLNTTDTNTLGRLRLYVNESGALPVWRDFMVLPANIYDSLVGGSDYIDVSMVQVSGSAVSTTTAQIGVNVVQISADSTAADNAEAFFDGTGYAGTGNTIPTVTTVTNAVSANVTQISGDSVAADNAESFFDGTGYAGTNNTIPTVTNVTTVNGLAANVITASAIAADAIGASELAADAATEIGTAVWATAVRTLTAATNVTSTGAAVPITAGGLVSADVTAISTDTTAANNAESFFDGTGYAGTNNTIPTVTAVTGNVGGNVAGSVGSVTGNVGGNVTGSVGSVTGNVGGNVTGSVGSLAAQAKADVNAEVVDAISTDTYAEPGSVPAATSSIKDKIGFVFAALRNKHLTTATTDVIRNDADSGAIGTAALNEDGTTFSRGEYA